MELEQIAELIDRVSASELDSFCLEQNGMRLSLKKMCIRDSRETVRSLSGAGGG